MTPGGLELLGKGEDLEDLGRGKRLDGEEVLHGKTKIGRGDLWMKERGMPRGEHQTDNLELKNSGITGLEECACALTRRQVMP